MSWHWDVTFRLFKFWCTQAFCWRIPVQMYAHECMFRCPSNPRWCSYGTGLGIFNGHLWRRFFGNSPQLMYILYTAIFSIDELAYTTCWACARKEPSWSQFKCSLHSVFADRYSWQILGRGFSWSISHEFCRPPWVRGSPGFWPA